MLSSLIPEKEIKVPEEEDLPKTPPLHIMKSLLLQALLGSNLDPLIKVLDKVALKVDLLTSEMKTRNKIEETKITYNKAMDEARAGIKNALKKQEKERKDEAKKRQETDNA